jgi:uncharacterized protein YdbL (DUF1318 family)
MKIHQILMFVAGTFILHALINAQDGTVDMEVIQERMKARLPELAKLKDEGKIGEAYNGMVAARDGVDDDQKKLVDEENMDRLQVYNYMAQKFDITPKQVAISRHSKIRKAAKEGTWFKDKDGNWSQKE